MGNILQLYLSLMNNLGIGIIIALILSKTKFFKNLILNRGINLTGKILLSCIFGSLGIIATYTGVPVNGAIANFRAIGVVIGGILGGYWVGLGAGLIAGLHRWTIDIGGFTALACGIATVLEGVIGGIASKYIKGTTRIWYKAFFVTMFSQVIQMITILIVAKPFSDALELIKIIALPMITINSIGSALFMLIIEGIFVEQQKIGANGAQLALRIANKTLPIMRTGFNTTTLVKVANIILAMTDSDAVAFTDNEHIMVHVGSGSNHHVPGSDVLTKLTKKALETKRHQIASTHEEIGCNHETCSLNSAIIVPLISRNKVIGTMKLYSEEQHKINYMDIQLAHGLAHMFSTQIELSIMDDQTRLLEKAELTALQAQINPHFLFNAITTISSYCRTQPEVARNLLVNLGDYFRKNLNTVKSFVNLHDEIEHIKSYIAIEKARFGDKLTVIYDIGDINCKLPPLTLQPLVENAIKHGLLEKQGGGTITIRASQVKNEVRIVVEDDGVGISPEKCKSLLDPEKSIDSIALININSRLRNVYGDSYGLEIKSKVKQGTKVYVRIPLTESKKVVYE